MWCSAGRVAANQQWRLSCGCYSLATFQLPFLVVDALTVHAKIRCSRTQSDEPKHTHMVARMGKFYRRTRFSDPFKPRGYTLLRLLCNLYFTNGAVAFQPIISIFIIWWLNPLLLTQHWWIQQVVVLIHQVVA